MNSTQKTSIGLHLVTEGSNGLQSAPETLVEPLYGSETPRISSKPLDLPSKGHELVTFAEEIGLPLLPWQKWLAIEAHKVKEDGRWAHPVITPIVARQNGKTTMMMIRILGGMFLWEEGLQMGTAHRLSTSLETFRHLVDLIEQNEKLADQVKKIRWAHGSEEIQLKNGCRYMIKAGASAARGISKPETVYLDELREQKDEATWASLRYTMMAAKNPQIWTPTNMGDSHSIVLNQLRDRGAVAASGGRDDIGYFEWSAPSDKVEDTPEFWKGVAQANPALGHTIHIDNIRSVLNDPHDVVMTEVLCRPVATISAAIPAEEWNACGFDGLELDLERETWMGIDLSPDRKHAALVAAQQMDDEKVLVKLLHTWHNPISIDDKAVANEIAPYVHKYPTEVVAYSKRTASAVAARLLPAGIPITDIDGALYGQSCDELLSAVTSSRLVHTNQAELTKQILSAAKLPFGDGGWIIGRKASQSTVCATVASALAVHFATRASEEMEIFVV